MYQSKTCLFIPKSQVRWRLGQADPMWLVEFVVIDSCEQLHIDLNVDRHDRSLSKVIQEKIINLPNATDIVQCIFYTSNSGLTILCYSFYE